MIKRQIRNIGSIIVDELRLKFVENAFESIGHKKMLLDLGCAQKPFENVYERYTDHSVGTDVIFSPHDLNKIDIYASGMSLPFKESSFDIVLCTEVLEHVPEPQLLLQESHRVLRPGGVLILTTPFLVPVHEAPYDFYRYTVHGLEHLLHKPGFHVTSIEQFAELFGVLISFFVQSQLKFWNVISKKLRFPGTYSIFNPFIYLLVYLPQLLYLMLVKSGSSISFVRAIIQKLVYTTKGYGIVANK